MGKVALITCVAGQDGPYLAELSLFRQVGRREGVGTDETGIKSLSGEVLVRVDPQYFRCTEVDYLPGDSTREKNHLGWKHKTSFLEMVTSDLDQFLRERRVSVE